MEEKEEVKVYVGIKITWFNKGGIEKVIIREFRDKVMDN